MICLSTILIAISMVVIAAAIRVTLYYVGGFGVAETSVVALTALVFLILYNVVAMRLRDRGEVGVQIADLSLGVGDLARQVAEFGRRLAALENRMDAARAPPDALTTHRARDRRTRRAGELPLAISVATYDEVLAAQVASVVSRLGSKAVMLHRPQLQPPPSRSRRRS